MTAENTRIRELESEITKRDNTILMQQNSINDLKRQVENLTEIVLQMRHDKFGPSSEKTVKADDYLLHNIITKNCRAKWRILHLQNGENCRGYSDHQAMKNPLQT